ncbi:hypothetical protein SDC9_30648 [bioreactor metagenome]|uniref:Uncharacterized protein n=1 Tax=bioreactor metagenome TaxID=1076179 RepID=A0A644V1B3_9ZZZZ
MWMGGQVAEKMSPVSAADVGTVAVITVSGLIGPEPTHDILKGDGCFAPPSRPFSGWAIFPTTCHSLRSDRRSRMRTERTCANVRSHHTLECFQNGKPTV